MMAEIVIALYEKGLLRRLGPLRLIEQRTVRIQILPEKPVDEVDEIIQRLIADGVNRP
jgi:predicted DNA-binding antitoxin AbrB/MazE fold protein